MIIRHTEPIPMIWAEIDEGVYEAAELLEPTSQSMSRASQKPHASST